MTPKKLLATAVVISMSIPIIALAAEFKTGDQPSLPAGQTASNDLYMVGGTVSSAGAVRGDLVAAGGTVLINGPVSSDLIVAGGNITILGDVGDDVRAAGGNVLIQTAVKGDVIAAGGQVTLSGAGVGGDVATLGGSVRIDAPISGKVRIGGGQIVINAPITGDVEIQAEKLTLGSKALISGTLTYSATSEMTKEEGAVIKGKVNYTQRTDVRDAAKVGLAALVSLWVVSKFFMLLAGSFIFSIMFNRYSHELVQKSVERPWLEMLRALIFLIVTPIISVLLIVTVIGIPFGVLGLLSFIGSLIFAFLVSPIVVGSVVHKWIWKPTTYEITWKTILLGVLLSYVLDFIPFLGGLVKCAIILIVLGAALSVKWGIAKEWR